MSKLSLFIVIFALFAENALCFFPDWFWSTGDGVKCTWQSSSMYLNVSGTPITTWPGISIRQPLGCATSEHSCGSSKIVGSYTKSDALTGDEASYSYMTESKPFRGCTHNDTCQQFAGGDNGCKYSQYSFETWIPRSCDAENDYDAYSEQHDVKKYYSCCNGADYCNQDVDYSECTKSVGFSTYMTDMNVCWNNVKKDFYTDLLCDGEEDLLTWSDECTEADGSWISKIKRASAVNCTYQITCTQDILDLLVTFGQCACDAATSSGYTGEFIGTAMQASWERFCPDLDIECASNKTMAVIRRFWKTKYSATLVNAKNTTQAAIKKLKRVIADKLDVANNLVDVTIVDNVITINIEVGDEGTATQMSTALDGEDNTVTEITGGSVNNAKVENEEQSSVTYSTYNSSVGRIQYVVLYTLVAFICAISLF